MHSTSSLKPRSSWAGEILAQRGWTDLENEQEKQGFEFACESSSATHDSTNLHAQRRLKHERHGALGNALGLELGLGRLVYRKQRPPI